MNINVTAGWHGEEIKMNYRKALRSSLAFRMPCIRLGLAATLLLLAAPNFAQTAKPALKPIDVFDLQWAEDPQISPDGRSIAYGRMSFDIKTDRPRGMVWLLAVDGTRLAYLAAGTDGSTQLLVYWTDTAATAAISNFTESPGGLAWSPDGRWLAFTMAVAAERKPLKVELPDTPKNAKWAEPPKLIDRMVFRVDGEGYLPNVFSQLFVIGADGGAARQLTQGDFDHDGTPAFTADGKSVLISANRRA